jgi:hypothetical protein
MQNPLVGRTVIATVVDGPVVAEATTIGFYLIYASVAVSLVVFLARTLSRNGQIFLEEAFEREELASSINQLLVIGFYLLNLGYALLVYRVQASYPTLIGAFNDLMTNIGILLASLGALHLFNMAVLWRIGGKMLRGAKPEEPPAPPAPAYWSAPAPVAAAADRYPDYQLEQTAPADGSDLPG